ncbi:MAG TPA: EAL domain-containing protein [Noviherbaspirillum sp.]|uniref:EAL domain-containing protein n=1 Tax=Noviherbaspirillum sp. TaxID=1926288 RepID=UPI002D395C0B|nr:EAL domain-containing protein [Noviherbaspirillum sp.]HYD94649.1 EAL domain-containing protein [Noviherbaspirillum sp.]
MRQLEELLDLVARKIGLSTDDIARRSAVFDITDADIALLRQLHDKLAAHQPPLVESFHSYLTQFPELKQWLGDGDKLERLKQAQLGYFNRLSQGNYDSGYVTDRLRVGLVHQQIGLEPKWYVGAYRKYLSDVIPVLAEAAAGDREQFFRACDALLKVVCFDMVLALDTYFEADRSEVVRVKNYAEQMLASIPSGLIVLDAELKIRSMNHAMCRMFRLGAGDEVAGLPLTAVVWSRQLTEALKTALATGEGMRDLVISVIDDSGKRHFEFDISAALLRQENVLLLMGQDITGRVQSQEELRRFRMALDSSIDAVYLIDREEMRFIDANETALATLGYSYEELLQLGPQDLKPDEGELERVHRRFDEVIVSESKTGMIQTVHQRKDGSRLPVEVYLRAIQSEGRQLLVAVVRDLTDRLQAEAVLRESEERFRVAFNQAAVGLAHVAPDGRWLMVNNKLCDIVGYSRKELLSMSFQDITHPEDLVADWALARRMIAGEIYEKTREKRYRHKAGYYIWVNLTSSMVRDAAGSPKYYSTVVEDISRRKQVEEELLHLANHDSLTSLPNRSLLLDRLAQALVFARRSDARVAVMLIDLDRFKTINDSLGHDIGDKIIIEISRRLSACIRAGDTIARLGGDEFVVIRPDVAREDAVASMAQQILAGLAQPITLQGHEFFPTASIGISVFPKDGTDGQTLLKNADMAMYRAKDAGRNTFQFYAHEMNTRALDRLKLESGLRRALERQEFAVHYQPQMDIASGRVMGAEALLRWAPPGQTMVFPGDFIPIAEETGLIVPIGEWVLRQACMQKREWHRAGMFTDLKLAVNLSARQFKQQDMVKMVSRVLAETGCRPEWLELEITESIIMENPEAAAETLHRLSAMGVRLAIDDFGTGYSSLSYLKRFPIDALKIDRSFVRDITTDADDAAIAKAVIALAHSLKLAVIAEGVETIEQLDFLREQKCDQMQGYFLSRPLPVDQFGAFLLQGKCA